MRACVCACIRACMHACIHACMCACVCVCERQGLNQHFTFPIWEAIFKFFKCEVYIPYFLKNEKHKVCLKRFNFLLRLLTVVIRSIQIVKHVTYLGGVITLLIDSVLFLKKQINKQFFSPFLFFIPILKG